LDNKIHTGKGGLVTTKSLSYHPLYSISRGGIPEPARNANSHTALSRSSKSTKLEVLPLPHSPLAKHTLKIGLPLEAHPRGKPAIVAVTHAKTIANGAIYCKNTHIARVLASLCLPENYKKYESLGELHATWDETYPVKRCTLLAP